MTILQYPKKKSILKLITYIIKERNIHLSVNWIFNMMLGYSTDKPQIQFDDTRLSQINASYTYQKYHMRIIDPLKSCFIISLIILKLIIL